MNASQRRNYSRMVEKINRRLEDKFLPSVSRAIQEKTKGLIAALKEGGIDAVMKWATTDVANEPLGRAVNELYRVVANRHARRVNNELRNQPMRLKYVSGRLGYSEEWVSFMKAYLESNMFNLITINVNETTRKLLLAVVQKGIEDGLGVDDITRMLEGSNIHRWQAARIVRTEVNRAANVGASAASETFEYEQNKEWISHVDFRTRGQKPNQHANHVELDGNVTDADGLFVDVRNGDMMKFPGDPSASAASVVNCRCTVGYVAKRDADGRLIPKQKQSRVTVIMPGQFNRQSQVITV